jgi:hypothetical protein
MIRYNSSDNVFEVYENGSWINLIRGYIGGLTMIGKANCNWTVTTSWAAMSANANCNTLTTDGSAISPGKYPAIQFATLPPGRYKITFNIPADSGTNICLFRITDGTNTAGLAHALGNGLDYVMGDFNYTTTQTNITFTLQAKAQSSNDCWVYGDAANSSLPVTDFVFKFYAEKIQ